MLSNILQRICKQRGIEVVLSPNAPFLVADDSRGAGPYISRWDESVLGPRPTKAEIDAIDVAALQAAIEAEEANERDLQDWQRTKARAIAREIVRHVKALEAVVKVKFPNVPLPDWTIED
jgi:hypothetical protein